MRKTILLPVISLFLSYNACAQMYTLSVTNGYGGGSYMAGDTVDIWCEAIPYTASFDKWTGDVATLESPDEWHTTLVMPAQNIAVSATMKNIGNIAINYEKIQGRDTLKNVYSYFPANFKGVIFCFHGTGGAASNWVTLLEYRQFLNDAIADTFAFIITEAEEITKKTDFDNNGKLRWATYPIDTLANVDYVNIKALRDTFLRRGITTPATPYFTVGMSNGGNFAPAVANAFGWKAAVSYCAQSAQSFISTTTIPIQWCMAKYDDNENVGAAGNAAALLNHNTLLNRGICSNYFVHDRSPVYAGRFMRSGIITQTAADNVFAEMKTNQLVDVNNYLLYASDTIAAKIAANPQAYPAFLSLNVLQRAFIAGQVDVMYAAHQFYSDYNKRTLRFFNSLCDTIPSVPSGIEPVAGDVTNFSVYPIPTDNEVTIVSETELVGQPVFVYDLSGRIVYQTSVSAAVFTLPVKQLDKGVYLLKINNTAKRFLKQ